MNENCGTRTEQITIVERFCKKCDTRTEQMHKQGLNPNDPYDDYGLYSVCVECKQINRW